MTLEARVDPCAASSTRDRKREGLSLNFLLVQINLPLEFSTVSGNREISRLDYYIITSLRHKFIEMYAPE